jgi:hypothetical protein
MSTDCGFFPLLTKIGRCRNFGKNAPVQNITKVHLVGIELFHAVKQRDGQVSRKKVLAVFLQVRLQMEVHVLNESPRQESIGGSVDMTGLALAGVAWLASHHRCFITGELYRFQAYSN